MARRTVFVIFSFWQQWPHSYSNFGRPSGHSCKYNRNLLYTEVIYFFTENLYSFVYFFQVSNTFLSLVQLISAINEVCASPLPHFSSNMPEVHLILFIYICLFKFVFVCICSLINFSLFIFIKFFICLFANVLILFFRCCWGIRIQSNYCCYLCLQIYRINVAIIVTDILQSAIPRLSF